MNCVQGLAEALRHVAGVGWGVPGTGPLQPLCLWLAMSEISLPTWSPCDRAHRRDTYGQGAGDLGSLGQVLRREAAGVLPGACVPLALGPP